MARCHREDLRSGSAPAMVEQWRRCHREDLHSGCAPTMVEQWRAVM
jgi:hypothetical protein